MRFPMIGMVLALGAVLGVTAFTASIHGDNVNAKEATRAGKGIVAGVGTGGAFWAITQIVQIAFRKDQA